MTYIWFQRNFNFDFPKTGQVPIHTSLTVDVADNVDPNGTRVSLIANVGDKKNSPFEIEAKITAEFYWDKDISPELVSLLLSRNAPALLLGYLRPIIADTTQKAGLPAYNLPFMDFT